MQRYKTVTILALAFVGITAIVFVGLRLSFGGAHHKQTSSTLSQTPTLTAQKTEQSASTPVVAAPIKPDYTIPPAVNGRAPLLTRIPTKQPVVFIGIDDGITKDPRQIELLKKYNVKASLYLAYTFIANNPDHFKPMVKNGSVIQNHSVSHDTRMSTKPYAYQKQEICRGADLLGQTFGVRPVFFRPPGGGYTDTTLRAAHDCGMKAVVNWIAKANGGSMQYQIGNVLRPGDIVLMHFRPEFENDLKAFVEARDRAGLHTELLEDWLK